MPSPSESKGIERFLAEEAAYGLFFIGTPTQSKNLLVAYASEETPASITHQMLPNTL